MKQSLGRLPNAPLIYVLAQVKFSRVPNMKNLWEDFHQRVFDAYPESQVEHIEQFAIKKEGLESSPETQWNLLNRERSQGFLLKPDMLILHSSSYETSDTFFSDLEFGLSCLVSIVPSSVQVNRLGLRYVDILLPQDDLKADEQIVDKLGVLDLDSIGCSPMRSERVSKYRTSIGGELVFRNKQTIGADVLPSELFPNVLRPAPILSTPKVPDSIVGSLDFDHYINVEIPLETDSVIAKFHDLQKVSSKVFKSVTTENARKYWSE